MEVARGAEARERTTQFEKTFDIRVRTPFFQELAHVGLVPQNALFLLRWLVLYFLCFGGKLKES